MCPRKKSKGFHFELRIGGSSGAGAGGGGSATGLGAVGRLGWISEPPLDVEPLVPLPVVVLVDAPVSLQYVGS